MKKRCILDDQSIWCDDRFTQPDWMIVDPAKRGHGSPHTLGTECRERLRVLSFEEGRNGQDFGGRHHALSPRPWIRT